MLQGDQQKELSEEDFYDIYDVPSSYKTNRTIPTNQISESDSWENAFL